MESFKFAFSCILAILAFQSIEAQDGQPPKCVQDLMAEQGFMTCMQGFMEFIKNTGELEKAGPPEEKGNAMMELICSKEGKAAMACMMGYIVQCPEISQQTGGMNFQEIMQKGGLDAACDLISGPCREVQTCLAAGMPMEGDGRMDMSGVKSANPFSNFLQQSHLACGPMKKQYDCIMTHLKNCEAQVRELEKALKNSIEMSMQGDNAIVSYDDFKQFMRDECGKMPKEIGQDSCVMGSLSSPDFLSCYQNATDMYTMEKGEKCSLYFMQSSCLDMYVGKKCGKDNASFMKDNMDKIIKNVPASCTITDTSKASKTGQIAAMTFTTLAVSLFFTL